MPHLDVNLWSQRFARWRRILTAYAVVTVTGILFFCMSNGGDLFLYTKYAGTAREAGLNGLYARETVEYPPLAAAFIVAVDRVGTLIPAENPLIHLKIYQAPPDLQEYKLAHRCVVVLIFLLTIWLVRRLCASCFPGDSDWEQFHRLLVFLASSLLSGYVLLDRLDLALAALVAASLGLLVRGRPLLSLAVLAAAIAFKLVPIILVPIWLLGTLPAEGFELRQVRIVLSRTALLAGCVALFCAPMFVIAGMRSFEFLTYHRARGIEYESSYAALLFALKPFGLPACVRAAFGSGDVESPLAAAMVRSAPLLVCASELAVFFLCAFGLHSRQTTPGNETYGQRFPRLFASLTMLAMLCLVLFNKVFSPQYVVWLLPLLPLVPLKGKGRIWFWACALGLCGVTALIYPLWWLDVRGADLPGEPGWMAGPGSLGTVLLLGRTALLIGLIGILFRWMLHTIRAKGNEPNHQDRQADGTRLHTFARRSRWLGNLLKSVSNMS
jgi:hypothetical protein